MGGESAVDTATAVVNLVDKVCTLVKSNTVVTMPEFASALPPGVDPNQVASWEGWSSTPQSLTDPILYEVNLPGFSNTSFSLGVRFNWGGKLPGQPFSYVKDLEAFVILNSVTLVHDLDIDVKFAKTGTPITQDHTVMLTGSFNVKVSHKLLGPEFSDFYAIRVFGNGAAQIEQQQQS